MPKHSASRVLRWQATIILTLFFSAVAGAAAIGWWYARESPPHQGPLVLIAADQLEPADISEPAMPAVPAAGEPTEPAEPPVSPALETLVRESVVFERAYTHSPLMLPALTSLLTGRLPFEHGVRDDAGYALKADDRTLAELLRNRGFRTGAAVWSPLLTADGGAARGFATFVERPAAALPDELYLLPVSARPPFDVPEESLDALDAALDARDTEAGAAVLEAAEQWIRAQNGQRFFLFLHVPRDRVEEAVDRISTLLRARRLYDGATIVLTALRGAGGPDRLDESALHVPLVVKQPHGEGAGRRVQALVQHADLVPTFLDLVRAPAPDDLRGRSLRPLLGDKEGRIVAQPVYSESLAAYLRYGGHPLFALTVNDARYVRGADEQIVRIASAEGGAPQETQPLPSAVESSSEATDALEPLAQMRAALDRFLSGHVIETPLPVPAADLERLALATGYLPALRPIPGVADVLVDDASQAALAAAHRRAARLVGERRLPAALYALRRIVRDHPALASVHYQIGLLSAATGATDDAIAAFEAAAALRPDAPEVPSALAASLVAAERPADAQVSAALAVTLAQAAGDPQALSAAHQQAARVALGRGDAETALQHADAAQAADPAIPMRPLVEGRLLVQEGEAARAAEILEEAAAMLRQHETTLAGVHLTLGDALAQLDRRDDAEAAYREELRAHPGSFEAAAGLVALYRDWKTDEEIDALVTQMLAAAPHQHRYAATARLLAQLGMPARAEAIRSEARARFRGGPSLARLARGTRR